MPKLTKRTVDAAEAGPKDLMVWDSELSGFGLRIKPSGRKTYVIQYRNAGRQSKRMTLGLHGRLTPDEARKLARQRLAAVDRGEDPSRERKQAIEAPTLRDLAKRYQREHAEPKKKASSAKNDQRMWELYVLPRYGSRKVAKLSREDVQSLHLAMKKTPYAANRTLALLRKAFNLAELWGWRPDGSNPCRHVQPFKEGRRERYLSQGELLGLAAVLQQAEVERTEMPSVIAAIRLLVFTGCRLNEILTLRWREVDLERACLHLSDSKTGRKAVYLSPPALQVLSGINRISGNPFVITGRESGKHLVNLKDPWYRLRVKAGLADVRLHDLRHTFASFGAAAGLSLPVIGKMLGHRQAATTQRYAHLADSPLREAVDRVGSDLASAMSGDDLGPRR